MKLGTEIALRQKTGLKLTQVLGGAIGLLELSNLDLAQKLRDVAADNPWLRLRLPRALVEAGADIPADGPSLLAHVTERLPHLVRGADDRPIAIALLDALGPAGYISVPPEEIAHRLGVATIRVETVLADLQKIEPRGLFARSLSECLALQLDATAAAHPVMRRVLAALPLMADGGTAAVVRVSGLTEGEVDGALAILRSLDPRPVAAFATATAPTRVADLIFRPVAAGWEATLNPDTLPRVSFRDVAAQTPRGSRYAEERRAAQNLIRAIERRNTSLLSLGQILVQEQEGFLTHGPIAQRALSRRSVAAMLRLHESSVSRLVNASSAMTPMGTIPLCGFFGASGRRSRDLTIEAGPLALIERVKQIVISEGDARPMSDSEIAAQLADEGLAVPRRMVARLRARAGIRNRHQR
jgi:RNA polymerase sigma-54 factor